MTLGHTFISDCMMLSVFLIGIKRQDGNHDDYLNARVFKSCKCSYDPKY